MTNLKIYLNTIENAPLNAHSFSVKRHFPNVHRIMEIDSELLKYDILGVYTNECAIKIDSPYYNNIWENYEDIKVENQLYFIDKVFINEWITELKNPLKAVENIENFFNVKIQNIDIEIEKFKNIIKIIKAEHEKGNACALSFR